MATETAAPPVITTAHLVARGLASAAKRRKAEIDRILADEYAGGVPPDSALRVVDDAFCMHGRPVAGYYTEAEGGGYTRIDAHPDSWCIARNSRGRWWFTTHGKGELAYVIAYEAVVEADYYCSAPPASGWTAYSATAFDHVRLIGSELRVDVVTGAPNK